jgi:hypothetical protein
MAQTISAQRGTLSLSPNTDTTVFTNSSSGSSRVIINSVAWFMTPTATSLIASGLFIQNSAGGTMIPFALARTTMSNQYCQVYVPGTVPVGQLGSSTAGHFTFINNGSSASTNPNQMQLNYTGTSIISNFAYCPKTIWLGPSDLFRARMTNDQGENMNLVYNFTVITET